MFRFSIRDVLWLTVVVGLALGWWLDRSQLSQARIDLGSKALSRSGEINYFRDEMGFYKAALDKAKMSSEAGGDKSN